MNVVKKRGVGFFRSVMRILQGDPKFSVCLFVVTQLNKEDLSIVYSVLEWILIKGQVSSKRLL